MENIIRGAHIFSKFFLYAWFAFILYLSLKKCFWKKGESRIKLIVITIVTNPLFTYFEALAVSYFLDVFIWPKFEDYLHGHGMLTVLSVLLTGFSLALFYMALILFYSWLNTKLFGKETKSSMLFLYVMFNTLYIVSFRGSGSGEMFSIPYLREFTDIASEVILFFAVWLFYHLDVRMLSDIARVRVKIDWRVFTLPPTIFMFLYTVYTAINIYNKNSHEEQMVLTVYAFSTTIVFLFIWAFYIIIKNIKAADVIKELSVEVMEALAHTIDAKDEYTRGHSIRVANYSRMVAKKMGLSDEKCEDVYYMGLLHDLGKIGVPNEIINSPQKLTDDQYNIIKKHPRLGSVILSEIKSRPDLMTGARWHHERYDGKGYPDGKSGEDIPLMARIIAVADSYDAMTSNRSYRSYMPQDKVRSEIEKNSGTQFDPKIAECMIKIIDEDKEYTLHE